MNLFRFSIGLMALFFVVQAPVFAESQGNDYKGITDPFGDPSNYEFAEDEKEDKEFFHLGRFLTFGVDLGLGAFTGGLGATNSPGFLLGARLVYFFDRSLAFEGAFHFAKHIDQITAAGGSMTIDTELMPITLGIRYYFDTRSAPKAIALANPYIALAGGVYLRNQNVTANSGLTSNGQGSETAFGFAPGAGVEFNIYRQHIYLGADIRYHFVFFGDENDTFNGNLVEGDRAGDYFTGALSITYSF